MTYQVSIERSAMKALSRIANPERQKILRRIESLADDPRPAGCRKLVGRPAWRLRSGAYRILYEIHDDQLVVLVVALGHRSRIYRDR